MPFATTGSKPWSSVVLRFQTSWRRPFAPIPFGAAFVRPAPGRTATYHVDPVPDPFRAALEDTLDALDWTGGGTLSVIEAEDGTRWLDAWRPRFDAAVGGVARCGVNLPARLVAAASGAAVLLLAASFGLFWGFDRGGRSHVDP